jgi:hypothetical protein
MMERIRPAHCSLSSVPSPNGAVGAIGALAEVFGEVIPVQDGDSVRKVHFRDAPDPMTPVADERTQASFLIPALARFSPQVRPESLHVSKPGNAAFSLLSPTRSAYCPHPHLVPFAVGVDHRAVGKYTTALTSFP